MNRNKILLALLFFAIALPFEMAGQSNSKCTIKGTITSQLDYVWLHDMNGNPIDSCAVQNGTFTFICDQSTTTVVTIMPKNKSTRLPLIPEAQEIFVTIGDGPAIVTGSPLSNELRELQQWIMKQFNDANDKAWPLREAGMPEEAQAVMDEMQKTLVDHCKEVYLKHLNDPVGVQAMGFLINGVSKEEFINLYKQGGDCIHNDADIAGYYESLTMTGGTYLP